MINTDARAVEYLRDDADPGECYRCGGEPWVIHHTSYVPEVTVPVCHTCHGRIHSDRGSDDLQPERKRPDGYQTVRKRQERLLVDTNPDEWKPRRREASRKRSCADCGNSHVVGCMYPYRADYGALRRAHGHPFSERGVEWYCFRCAGSLPPLSNVR